MLQLYVGNGKGKTSAAIGCAVRACGAGLKVLFIQFFKNGDSSECQILNGLCGCSLRISKIQYKLFDEKNKQVKKELKEEYDELVKEAFSGDFDVIVLDEGIDAYEHGFLSGELLLKNIEHSKDTREIILTGRKVPTEIEPLADYISEIKMIKHPYTVGVKARKGIEY